MLTRGGFIVKKENLTEQDICKLKNVLTVSPQIQGSGGFVNADTFPVFRESKSRFRIPRYYGIENFGNPVIKIPNGVPINVEFKGKLKESTNQDVAVDKALAHLSNFGGGILSLPTGFGKTCVSLYILSKLKLKTLIIVHKEFLMNQWIERIKQFLPEASIGIIQQNKKDIVGKDIVIGMLQSLAMKEYESNTFETFGFTIIDETHHISSKVFSKALFNVCTKHMLGLSATPIRKDGLTKVLNWFIGDIFYSVERENQTSVNVNIHRFRCEQYQNDPPLNKLGKISLATVINSLVLIEERNELIYSLLLECVEKKRKVILLSDRRNHCELLHDKIKTSKLDYTSGLYMGGMKQEQLDESEKCDIILATFSLAHEGLDIPSLDTLILATPKTDIVQSCGRILRETTGKKNNPLIIDICDMFASLPAQANKRKKYYTDSGFIIDGKSNTKKSHKQTTGYCFIEE